MIRFLIYLFLMPTLVIASGPLSPPGGNAITPGALVPAASMPAFSGDVSTQAGATVTTIGSGKVTNAMLAGGIDMSKLSGVLGVTSGGTGTATAMTSGSVLVANGSGIYSQDNAHLYYDLTTHQLIVGNNVVDTNTLMSVDMDSLTFNNVLGARGSIAGVSSSNQQHGILSNATFAPTNGSSLSTSFGDAGTWAIPTGKTTAQGASYHASPSFVGNAGTVTNFSGFYYDGGQASGAGTVTNNYGAYFLDPVYGTHKIALYADDLAIGTTGTAPPTNGVLVKGQIKSTVATGTAPFDVASTTEVANLHAATATTATNTTNLTTTNDTTTDADYYPTLQAAISGTNPLYTSSTKLVYHPSTGYLGLGASPVAPFHLIATPPTAGYTDVNGNSTMHPVNLTYIADTTAPVDGGHTGTTVDYLVNPDGPLSYDVAAARNSIASASANAQTMTGGYLFGTVNTAAHAAASNINSLYGVYSEVVNNNASATVTHATGVRSNSFNNSSGTMTTSYGIESYASNKSTGNVGSAALFYGKVINYKSGGTAGTMTNAYGLYVYDLANNGTITNTYGIYLGSLTSATQTNKAYNIYESDTAAKNRFSSHIGYGGSAPTVSSCGISPSIDAHATDASGTVTIGSGTVASCTITFNVAYTTWNHCIVSPHTASLVAFGYSFTTSAITVTATSLTSAVIDYRCDGD